MTKEPVERGTVVRLSEDQWDIFVTAFSLRIIMWGFHRLRNTEDTNKLKSATAGVMAATEKVAEATAKVDASLATMAEETSRAQRLAIRVGVATGFGGALFGGIAGAVAARLIGAG